MVWRFGTLGLEVWYHGSGGWVLQVWRFGTVGFEVWYFGCISGGATVGK